MQYLPTMAFQSVAFMYSAGLGFALGIIYDLCRIIFYLFTGSDKKYITIRDIIFLTICLASTFLYILVMCDGQLLLYVFIGEALGLWAYFYSVSAILYLPAKRFICVMRRQITKIKLFFIGIKTYFLEIYKKADKNLHNCLFFLRKHLHIRRNIVYNLFVKLCPSLFFKNRGDGSGKGQEE